MQLGQLRELARLLSIQLTYEDAAGKTRQAGRDALRAAIEVRLRSGRELEAELRERRARAWQRLIQPVVVAWGRRAPLLDLRLPRAVADADLRWILKSETGEVREGAIDLTAHAAEWSEGEHVGKTASLPQLQHGYHSLRVELGGRSAEALVVAAPFTAHPLRGRAWGVFAPLYAMRTSATRGAGDLGAMRDYREWVNSLGGGVLATLPMLAADLEGDPSPYSPLSRLYWNELYLDVRSLPEFNPATDELTRSDDERVDYGATARERRTLLESLQSRFHPDEHFERFAEQARGYAEFRARKEGRDSLPYHLYVQYRMAQQMRATADDARRNGAGLYLDFPIGVSPGGYDAEAYADVFAQGVSVGAPPDLFFTKGQNWGFAPFDPDALRESGYECFRAAIRHHMSHAGILRMDHVMGLHRLFWIPEGGEAKDGVYVRYPEEELYAIITLESRRHRCAIVGEDLGTVPQYVPMMMSKHGFRRMFVVQYEIKPEAPALGEPSSESVASVNTHDMPTFRGFWEGRDIDDRVDQGLLDAKGADQERETREAMRESLKAMLRERGLLRGDREDTLQILEAVLAVLGSSSAEIVLVNLEDLWLEERPQNVPGVPERSWRQRFHLTLEQARNDGNVTRILQALDQRRRMDDGSQTQEGQHRNRNSDDAAGTAESAHPSRKAG